MKTVSRYISYRGFSVSFQLYSEPTSPQRTVKENPTSLPDVDTEGPIDLSEKPSLPDVDTEGPVDLSEKPSVVKKDVTALPVLIAHCDKCKKPRSACPDGLKKCTRCLKSYYCSRVCQSADWHWHKLFCKPPA